MLFLAADVVYHPFQILRAETNDAIARLPVQQLAIGKLMIDVMRARAFDLSDPFADQQRWRNRNRDMNMSLNTTDLMKD